MLHNSMGPFTVWDEQDVCKYLIVSINVIFPFHLVIGHRGVIFKWNVYIGIWRPTITKSPRDAASIAKIGSLNEAPGFYFGKVPAIFFGLILFPKFQDYGTNCAFGKFSLRDGHHIGGLVGNPPEFFWERSFDSRFLRWRQKPHFTI